ncbi:TonB-dependent receptor [Hydrocarboniphaga effusa]|uniref:TonB-dependent receptor n=1 Tax=Hydrocarboniphaga effusa TaxID=243629 RepID=UPI003BAC0E1F
MNHSSRAMMMSLLAMICLTAAAQDDASQAAPGVDEGGIAEVVVTAQRREEKLQDVPLAVTAFSSEQIESRGIQSVDDLSALAPGLQISRTPSNTTISQIAIRGVTQINPAIYWDPAVGIYVDGVYIGKAQGSIFDVVDLAQVEVLRGPQGTLYGRNTLAGAISLRTRAPSGQFSGSASLEYGNYNALVQKASVDLPQWGIARISIGVRSERRDGWVDTARTSSVDELNNRHNDAVRIAADFDFADDWTGEYRFDRSNVNQSNNYNQLYRLRQTGLFDAGFGPLADLYPVLASYASTQRQDQADIDAPTFEQARIMGHSFTLSWDLAEQITLKSITGYRRLEWNDSIDIDGSPLAFVFTQRFTDYDQLSQDLQLLGSGECVNYVAGVYYFGDEGDTYNPQQLIFGGANYDSRYGTKTSAWAAYGQIDYRLTEQLTAALGARYTREKKDLTRSFGVSGSTSDPFFYFIPDGTRASGDFEATTPMASLAWRAAQGVNLYARYAEGFKSGGFNGEYSNTAPPADRPNINIEETQTPFKPEKQRSFEVGAKTTWFDGKALFNLALFHNELKDMQTSTFVGGETSAAGSVIRNAGEATVQGAEIEAVFVPVKGTQLRLSYAYLDAEYDEFTDLVRNPDDATPADASDAGSFVAGNAADNRAFVHAPKQTFNALLDSVLHRAAWGTLRGVVDYAYTGAFFTYPYQLDGPGSTQYNPANQVAADTRVKAYGLLNLRLALADIRVGSGGSAELALWMRNVTDEDAATNYIDFGPSFGSLTVANFVEPRTFGITGTVRW